MRWAEREGIRRKWKWKKSCPLRKKPPAPRSSSFLYTNFALRVVIVERGEEEIDAFEANQSKRERERDTLFCPFHSFLFFPLLPFFPSSWLFFTQVIIIIAFLMPTLFKYLVRKYIYMYIYILVFHFKFKQL